MRTELNRQVNEQNSMVRNTKKEIKLEMAKGSSFEAQSMARSSGRDSFKHAQGIAMIVNDYMDLNNSENLSEILE